MFSKIVTNKTENNLHERALIFYEIADLDRAMSHVRSVLAAKRTRVFKSVNYLGGSSKLLQFAYRM